MARYGSGSGYRRRLGGGYGGGGRVMAPFGRPLYPVPYKRKRGNGSVGGPMRMGRMVRRKIGSRTITKRKQKRKFGTSTKTGENTSISALRMGARCSRSNALLYKKAVGRQTYTTNVATQTSSATGKQGIYVNSILNRADMTLIQTAVQGTVNTKNAKFFIGYSKHRTVIRNQTNCSSKMLIYDLTWKHSPLSTTCDTPLEAWAKGYTDFGATGQNYVVGNTPLQSPEFRRYCNVKKVTCVPLEPGQQHEHTVYNKINRAVNSTEFDAAFGLESVKGITSFTMIVWYGSLAHEADNSKVSFAPVKLDIAEFTEYNYAWIPGQDATYTAVNNLSTAAWVDADQMVETGDQDGNVIAA